MNLNEAMKERFKEATENEWKEAAEKALKGKDIDTLQTETIEQILLKPLYSESTATFRELPGKAPFTRGIYPNGYADQPLWFCQMAKGETAQKVLENIQKAMKEGQNVISFSIENTMDSNFIKEIIQNLSLDQSPIFVEAGGSQQIIMDNLESSQKLRGVVSRDLVTEWAVNGWMPKNENAYIKQWLSGVKEWKDTCPHIDTVMVDVKPYHEAGADAVKEVAYAMAIGADYIWRGMEAGLSAEQMAETMTFSFSIDSSFFMQLAKLRAARKLWAAVGKGYGLEEKFRMKIHARTSQRNKTSYDRHVNLLRTTNEAFAAVLGSCQYLTIGAFDELLAEETSLGQRMAINIAHIIQEETAVMQTTDPAGGSFYIEELTNQICERAWKMFQELEKNGGILEELKKGSIQIELSEEAAERIEAVAKRTITIVGVNAYTNPLEDSLLRKQPQNIFQPNHRENMMEITKLKPVNLASEFEELRSINLSKNNQPSEVALVGLGALPKYKSYMDFAKELAASGGIQYTEFPEIQDTDELQKILADSGWRHVIICGREDGWNGNLVDMTDKTSASVYLVGKFTDETIAISAKSNWKVMKQETNIIEILQEISATEVVK